MELTRAVVAAKWNEIVRNRLSTDKGSNDWVWRLVQWAIVAQDAEIERLRTENATQAATIGELKVLVDQQAQAMRRADAALQEQAANSERWMAAYARAGGRVSP